MADVFARLQQSPGLANLVLSGLFVLCAIFGRALALRWLRGQNMPPDSTLRWRAQVRNATILLIVLGLTIIWAEQLRAAALSVVAIAAALVIGMKELLMCLTGSLLRASGQQFRIGDRVEIAGYRGDVIDVGPLTTSLLEVGPGAMIHQRSGRVVVLPNSVFLTSPVINETVTHAFVLHVLRVPLSRTADWRGARDLLLTIARDETKDFVGDASETMTRLAVDRGLAATSIQPSVYVELTKPDELELLLRFPSPVTERGKLAQRILARFLDGAAAPVAASNQG